MNLRGSLIIFIKSGWTEFISLYPSNQTLKRNHSIPSNIPNQTRKQNRPIPVERNHDIPFYFVLKLNTPLTLWHPFSYIKYYVAIHKNMGDSGRYKIKTISINMYDSDASMSNPALCISTYPWFRLKSTYPSIVIKRRWDGTIVTIPVHRKQWLLEQPECDRE